MTTCQAFRGLSTSSVRFGSTCRQRRTARCLGAKHSQQFDLRLRSAPRLGPIRGALRRRVPVGVRRPDVGQARPRRTITARDRHSRSQRRDISHMVLDRAGLAQDPSLNGKAPAVAEAFLVGAERIELSASPLPRGSSATELRRGRATSPSPPEPSSLHIRGLRSRARSGTYFSGIGDYQHSADPLPDLIARGACTRDRPAPRDIIDKAVAQTIAGLLIEEAE